MSYDIDDLQDLADHPTIRQHTINYIKTYLRSESPAHIEDIDDSTGRVTVRFSNLGVIRIREDHPEIIEVDITGKGMCLTFDLTETIEQLGESLDINKCPQCAHNLEPIDSNERVCEGCEDRYVVNTVSFIQRLSLGSGFLS